MSTVQAANAVVPGTGAPAPTAADVAQEASDRFLTLLVTQLRNQDPLNPLDNAQVTTQMAQISTVSGINKLNETIGALAASFAAGQYLQAVGLVGHEVTIAGDRVELADGKGAYGMALAGDADAALPDGQYTISITATAKGEAVAVDPLTIAQVTGVAPTAAGTVVTLGGIGNVALADILQIH